ncbi:MAG: hypothetical protein JO353_08000, partial [Phycisphaerae bacterium]|nr:hypothetical protein [Phycisphaerae bacterium]
LLDDLARQNDLNLTQDDVTVLMFRANSRGRRTAVKDRLLAPIRVLAGALDALRNRETPPLPDFKLANIGGAILPLFNRFNSGSSPANRPQSGQRK